MKQLDRPLLIHVAAAVEKRGRVVLVAASGSPHPAAITTALDLARAFDAAIECLLLTCPDLRGLAALGFAREISHAGRIAPLRAEGIAVHQTAEAARAQRTIMDAAQRANVPFSARVIASTLAEALDDACTLEGPWNIAVLTDPVRAGDRHDVVRLLSTISGTTGIVCVGPDAIAKPAAGIAILVDDVERLPHMLRVAARIATAKNGKSVGGITLWPVGLTAGHTLALDAHLQVLAASGTNETEIPVFTGKMSSTYGGAATTNATSAAHLLHRLDACLLIASAGSVIAPADGDLALQLKGLRCPLLLVR